MFSKTKYTKEEFIKAINESISKAEVFRKLNLKITGSNYKILNSKIKKLGLDTSHFTGQAHLKGKTHSWSKKRPLDKVLIKDSDYLNTSSLKARLLKESILKNECYICFLPPKWNNKNLVMHLDHINGVSDDNRIENLRLLCPNCHSQTITYAGRNSNRNKITKQCLDCNKEISKVSERCKSCAGKFREATKINWPPIEKLIEMVEESNYSATGRSLGVSDNAIRKRIKNYRK
jgi:hypothetical protein